MVLLLIIQTQDTTIWLCLALHSNQHVLYSKENWSHHNIMLTHTIVPTYIWRPHRLNMGSIYNENGHSFQRSTPSCQLRDDIEFSRDLEPRYLDITSNDFIVEDVYLFQFCRFKIKVLIFKSSDLSFHPFFYFRCDSLHPARWIPTILG